MTDGKKPSPNLLEKSHFNLLDSLLVLFASCSLVLFLFFLIGKIAGAGTIEDVPVFIKDAIGAVWTFVTGGLLSTIIYLVRRQMGGAVHPNYLLWILVTTSLLFVVVLAAASIIPPTEIKISVLVNDKLSGDAINSGIVKIQPYEERMLPQEPIANGRASFDELKPRYIEQSLTVIIEVPGYKRFLDTTEFKNVLRYALEKEDRIHSSIEIGFQFIHLEKASKTSPILLQHPGCDNCNCNGRHCHVNNGCLIEKFKYDAEEGNVLTIPIQRDSFVCIQGGNRCSMTSVTIKYYDENQIQLASGPGRYAEIEIHGWSLATTWRGTKTTYTKRKVLKDEKPKSVQIINNKASFTIPTTSKNAYISYKGKKILVDDLKTSDDVELIEFTPGNLENQYTVFVK